VTKINDRKNQSLSMTEKIGHKFSHRIDHRFGHRRW